MSDTLTTIEVDASLVYEAEATTNRYLSSYFPWIRESIIVKYVVEGLAYSPETPAWYTPDTNEIKVNLAAVFDNDPTVIEQALHQIATGAIANPEWKTVYGLLAHESSHSRWSTWLEAIGKVRPVPHPALAGTVILFEELRIEKRAADKGAAEHLRWSLRWLLDQFSSGPINTTPQGIAHAWALTVGRYIASIATFDEVEPFDTICRSALGDDVVDTLREILDEAVELTSRTDDGLVAGLLNLAAEWLEAIGLDEESESMVGTGLHDDEHGKLEDGEGAADGEGDGDPGDPGDGTPGGSEPDTPDSTDYIGSDPETEELLRAAAMDTMETLETPLDIKRGIDLANTSEMAQKVFQPGVEKKRETEKGSYVWHIEEPSAQDRTRAIHLARTLETLALPSVSTTHVPSVVPPGRLRSREAVRRSAEKARGMMSTATPWERAKRTRTTTKPVVVGVMTDTSGSMGWAEQFVAEFAWTVGQAGARIGARTAAVTFGNAAEMITRPNEIPDKIVRRSANGSTEMFDHAAAALDGVLHLSVPNGAAKVLFVVSDGELVHYDEPSRAVARVQQFTAGGTLVCWLACSGRYQKVYNAAQKPGAIEFMDPIYNPDTRTVNVDATVKAMADVVVRASRTMKWE